MSEERSDKGGAHTLPGGDRIAHARIGSRLREIYDHVLREPLPDRFLEIVKRLEERDRGKHN